MLVKEVSVGDNVRFYDSQMADRNKDYSGADPKYYPIGKVIAVYDYHSSFGYVDRVCDIQIGERISTAHFVMGVTIIPKGQ